MISHLSVPKDAVGTCVLGDRLYCVGGYDGQKHLKDVESYNPAEDKWTKVCIMLHLCYNVTALIWILD